MAALLPGLPDQATDQDGGGWELPWAVASLLWYSGEALPGGSHLDWSLESAGDTFEMRCASAGIDLPGKAVEAAERLLPAWSFPLTKDGWVLRIPGHWFESKTP